MGAVRCPPMRRLARHLFTLCSAVSLVLCVGALAFWVAGRRQAVKHWFGPAPDGGGVSHYWCFKSDRGRFGIGHQAEYDPGRPVSPIRSRGRGGGGVWVAQYPGWRLDR